LPILTRFQRPFDYSSHMGGASYPDDLDRVVPLRDGGTLHLRAIRSDDVGRLQAFHSRLSRDSIFYRFFSPLPVLTDERAAYFTTLDCNRRLAIVAVEGSGDDEQIVGVVRYDRDDADGAEFALIVEDRVQHHGIGGALFWALVEAARARGIVTFGADVMAENRRMLGLLRESGLPMRAQRARDLIRVEMDLTTRPDAP
jgi:GNAT superfamily N-acetyltransferase